jgi:hypothetical protein
VSQPCIRSQLGSVPSSPMAPVTKGRSSDNTSFPSSAFATPAPKRVANSVIWGAVPRAPAPIRIATLLPAFRTSAAFPRSVSSGTIFGLL